MSYSGLSIRIFLLFRWYSIPIKRSWIGVLSCQATSCLPVYIFFRAAAPHSLCGCRMNLPRFGLMLLLVNPKFSAISRNGSNFIILPNSLFSNVACIDHKNRCNSSKFSLPRPVGGIIYIKNINFLSH